MTRSLMIRLATVAALWVAVATATGCASGPGRFGDSARYDPAVRSYVLMPVHGADEQVDRRHVVVLGHPLTGDKLRCREEIEPWLAAQRAVASDDLHDENVAVGSVVALSPFAAVGSAIVILGIVVVSPVFIPMAAGMSDGAYELYKHGAEHFAAARYGEAAAHLQRAVLKSPDHIALLTPAFYYLGVSYSKLDRPQLATQAMQAFVRRSHYGNSEMYASAEAWLKYLGEPVSACASTDPLPVEWRTE